MRGSAPAIPVTPTLKEFFTVWRAEMAPRWRKIHQDSVDSIFEVHLLPALGATSLSAIREQDVHDLQRKMLSLPGRRNASMSPTTVNKAVGVLMQCIAAGR